MHAQDGLYFERLGDGSVRVVKYDDSTPNSVVVFETVLDEGVWCSVVATVSAGGEDNYRWFDAMAFHNGTPLPESIVRSRALA